MSRVKSHFWGLLTGEDDEEDEGEEPPPLDVPTWLSALEPMDADPRDDEEDR